MSPWIIFSVLVGPGRFELAVALALAATVALTATVRTLHRGSSLKILEVANIVFFGAMVVLGAVASPSTHTWLERYAGEISNLALVAIAFGSMAVRFPFTTQYARERVDRQYWYSHEFIRANYVVTAAWGLAFLVAALVGGFGDLVLHNPGNLWTGWIIQITAIVVALRFTEWYPRLALSRTLPGRPGPPVRSLLIPLVGLMIGIGIVVLILDAAASWFGVALLMGGVVLSRAIRKDVELTEAQRCPKEPRRRRLR
ncbi:hypothetical protein ACIHCQ_10170 [Streptomyces sp. NPDC052236]|uniref:hypothetical protein n=1 Tax=Streptomyces sp. NPDC052236 TaxID=3365686 RepID=UPI0037D912F1